MKVALKPLEGKHRDEIRSLRDSLGFIQREMHEYKELVKNMKKEKDSNVQRTDTMERKIMTDR